MQRKKGDDELTIIGSYSDYPDGATPVVASSANAAAANNLSLPAVAAKTNYVTGFDITGGGATAASIIAATLAGLIGGVTLNYRVPVPAGATVGIAPLSVRFEKPIPASAVNTAIDLAVPSFGAGNTNAAVALFGYVL